MQHPAFPRWLTRWPKTMLAVLLVTAAMAPLTAQLVMQRDTVPLTQKTDIKIVFEASVNEWHSDMGLHLHQLEQLLEVYEQAGVKTEDLSISVVFHREAAYWTLTDLAFDEQMMVETGNPNRPIIQALTQTGVRFELCRLAMVEFEWSENEILNEVHLVASAYARIVDLQHQGYALISH